MVVRSVIFTREVEHNWELEFIGYGNIIMIAIFDPANIDLA